MWKKVRSTLSMKIPGDIWASALTGVLLGITGALFITLPMSQTNDSTLGESIFGKNESLEIQLKLNEEQELQVKATGVTTMEVVQSLNKMLKSMDGTILLERYSPSTLHQGV